jgi:Flp pilus assembly pilin Flp
MRRVAERGATMLEYALVLTFIAVVVTTALVTFGPAVSDLFVTATNGL